LPSDFANRVVRDSSDALLYQLSYVGEDLTLLGVARLDVHALDAR